jgi:molecular chaperone GrpE
MSEEELQASDSGGTEVDPAGNETADERGPEEDAAALGSHPDGTEEGAGPEESGDAPESGDDGDASAQADAPSLEALERALEEARVEAQTHRDMSLRARAELENVRRRAERDVANAHRYGLERFVNEFLPVRDSLELGVSAAGDDADAARVREGMELTLKLMASAFEKLGIEVVDPAGQPFDPDLHQAMSMQDGEGTESGTVLTVVQKGYRLNERLVRPALVVVAK